MTLPKASRFATITKTAPYWTALNGGQWRAIVCCVCEDCEWQAPNISVPCRDDTANWTTNAEKTQRERFAAHNCEDYRE